MITLAGYRCIQCFGMGEALDDVWFAQTRVQQALGLELLARSGEANRSKLRALP
jgi:hypothetical protein